MSNARYYAIDSDWLLAFPTLASRDRYVENNPDFAQAIKVRPMRYVFDLEYPHYTTYGVVYYERKPDYRKVKRY